GDGGRRHVDPHDHAGTAAVGSVIYPVGAVAGEASQVARSDLDDAFADRAGHQRFTEVSVDQVGEERVDGEAHHHSAAGVYEPPGSSSPAGGSLRWIPSASRLTYGATRGS